MTMVMMSRQQLRMRRKKKMKTGKRRLGTQGICNL
jgi:hypothetical protein